MADARHFLAAVAAHVGLAIGLGDPRPAGLQGDSNAYLELAWNLWHHGEYASRVSVEYPPVVPMLYAPLMALESNALRFALIYAGHALAFGAASLLLLAPLTRALGRGRAWGALAALQLGGTAVIHGYLPQSEALFVAVLVAAAGALWAAIDKPSPGRWFGLGALLTLAVATRRIGLVVPVAGGLSIAGALVLRRKEPGVWAGLWALPLGMLAGWAPELLADALPGEASSAYKGNPVKGHLRAGRWGLESPQAVLAMARFFGLHLAWTLLATAGAPLLIAVGVLGRKEDRWRWGPTGDPAALALGAFAALAWLGMTTLSVLHVARYQFGGHKHPGWDLYPRYVDPAEPILIVGALVVVAGLASVDRRRTWTVAVVAALVVAAVSWPLDTVRGARLPDAAQWRKWGLAGLAQAMLAAPMLLLVLAQGWAFVTRRTATWGLILMLAGGWCLSLKSPLARAKPSSWTPPAVLAAPAIAEDPTAPLAVYVRRKSNFRRFYYEPAFRSDHPVDWLRSSEELQGWLGDHPGGFVLTHTKDKAIKLPVVARAGRWRIHQR